METSYQGLERNYFERVSYSAERFSFDKSTIPSKRTISQKFEIQYKKALNTLIDIQMFNDADYQGLRLSDVLINDYLKTIDPQSKNGAAFVLVFCCFNFYTKKFVIKKQKEEHLSWEDIVDFIDKPPSANFKKFIDEYSIKTKDLIRYLIFCIDKFEK